MSKSAEEWAARIFGVAIEHITEAPRHCGDGIDGDCDKEDCVIVGAVEELRAFAAQETAALQTEILRLQQVALSRTTPEHIQEWTEIAQLTRERDALQQRVEALGNLYNAALAFCHSIETTLKHGRASTRATLLEDAVRKVAALRGGEMGRGGCERKLRQIR